MHRYFRQSSTGQWVNADLGGSALATPAATHVEEIAGGLGILPADLEAVDSATDPREGVLLHPPVKPVCPSSDEALKREMAAAQTPGEGLAALKRWADARPG
jgi:hypothetical protein